MAAAVLVLATASSVLGFYPRPTHHCVDWVAQDTIGERTIYNVTGDTALCRARDFTPPPNDVLKSSTLMAVGDTLGIGLLQENGCELPGKDTLVTDFDVAVLDDSCRVWWRTVTNDVIPPIPELSVQFNDAENNIWLGLCRYRSDKSIAEQPEDTGWTLGVFHMSDVTLFGQCVVINGDGELERINGGGFDIVHARVMGAGCVDDPARAATLADDLSLRVSRFITESDKKRIEDITGHAFDSMLDKVLELSSCVLERILAPDRFVPHDLNIEGLHLLRCVLAESMSDSRRRALGYDKHPDYGEWMSNGVLFKNFDTLTDDELRGILRMASGEESNGIPRKFEYMGRNTTHTAGDPQYTMHIDTFTTAIKVWIFDDQVSVDDGPLYYVKGSQRNTDGKLSWMYNYTIPPALEAVIEPSLRLNKPTTEMDLGFERQIPVLSLPGVKRTLVVADTSGLHHRGEAPPGTIRFAMRLKGDNDGGLPRLNPWRMPEKHTLDPESEWDGQLRMSGCNADCGRVEIAHNGIWGYICSDAWTKKEADVVCRQLGFSSAFGVMPTFGGGKGKVWIGNVSCDGSENNLQDCKHSEWGIHNCGPTNAVGVSCIAKSQNPNSVDAAENAEDTKRYASFEPEDIDVPDEASGDCEIDEAVPMPFMANTKDAYVYGDRIASELLEMDAKFRKQLCSNSSYQEAIRELIDGGLGVNAYGFDFRALFRPGSGASVAPSGILDKRIQTLRSLYLSPNKHASLHSGFDNLIRYPLRCGEDLGRRKYGVSTDADDGVCYVQDPASQIEDPVARDLFKKLDRDGIVVIDDFGLDIETIKKTADWAVSQRGPASQGMTSVVSGGSVVASRLEIPEVEPVLDNSTIKDVLRAYLGGDMIANGYKVVKLQDQLKDGSQYIASEWHHDRVGRRLKMFVFLHDIDCTNGRPTKVANGSHDILFYKTEEFPWTRFEDSYVQDHYNIITACGKKGGGFIFDTNTIHKGTPFGLNDRTTVIFEFHPAEKCQFVKHRSMGIPCPSGDQWMIDRYM